MAKKLTTDQVKKAHALAREARRRSYSPYSKFAVGAALVLQDGSMIPGCNVENASYGATCCAERTAIFSAVALHGAKWKPAALMLVTDPVAFPCGLCLQVMGEFFEASAPVILADEKGVKEEKKFSDFLPNHFGPDFLKK